MAFSEDDLKFLKTENRSGGRRIVYTIICIILVVGFMGFSTLKSNPRSQKKANTLASKPTPKNTKPNARQALDELHELQRRREASIREAKKIVTSLKEMQTQSRTQTLAASANKTTSQSRPARPATAATSPKPETREREDPFKAYRTYSEAENARMAEQNARDRAAFDRNQEAKQLQRLREAQIQALEKLIKEGRAPYRSVYKRGRIHHIITPKETPPSFKPD